MGLDSPASAVLPDSIQRQFMEMKDATDICSKQPVPALPGSIMTMTAGWISLLSTVPESRDFPRGRSRRHIFIATIVKALSLT